MLRDFGGANVDLAAHASGEMLTGVVNEVGSCAQGPRQRLEFWSSLCLSQPISTALTVSSPPMEAAMDSVHNCRTLGSSNLPVVRRVHPALQTRGAVEFDVLSALHLLTFTLHNSGIHCHFTAARQHSPSLPPSHCLRSCVRRIGFPTTSKGDPCAEPNVAASLAQSSAPTCTTMVVRGAIPHWS